MSRPSFFRGAAAAALLAALGGCASEAERPRADFLETPSVGRAVEQARAHEAQAASAWPEDEWWRRFHDPALDAVMARALGANRGLMRAAARLREAEGLVEVEGSRLLPFIDADMGMRQSRIPNHGVVASYNPKLAGLEKTMGFINPFRLQYEFDFWGKNRAAVQAALGESAAEAAEFAETRLLLTTSVARAYFRAAAAARQAALAQRIAERRRDYLRVTENAFRSGLETEDAVKTAIEEQEIANKREAAARALLAFQQDLLARLMGEGPDATRDFFARGAAAATRPLVVPAHLPIELLAHRPDLTAAMHRAEAAAERIHVAKAEFLPSVDLTAISGVEASVTSTNAGKLASYLFRASAFNYQVMPGVHLPVFEGGRLRGRLEVRRGEYDEAVELYNETLLDAVRQVADGLANWRQTSSILSAQDRLLAARRDQLKLATGRWKSGLKDRRETLAVESGVLEQSYVRSGLEADHLAAVVDVIQALGGGYSSGVDVPRPRLAPEDSLAGMEKLSPAWNFGAATSAAASLFRSPAATEPQAAAGAKK